MYIALALFAVAVGFADLIPVRGFIAGSFVPGRVHKGFQKPQLLAESLLPILDQSSNVKGEYMGGEIANIHPWQDGRRMLIKLISSKSIIHFTHITEKR